MRQFIRRRRAAILFAAMVTAGVAGAVGCGGDARVELAASDALDGVAAQMQTAFAEYHGEVEAFDDGREAAVTAAFIARIRRDAADEAKCEQHGTEFAAALARIRADRRTEGVRSSRAAEQVAAVREVAAGLRRIGIASLSLQDEMRRYLMSWIEAQKRASAVNATTEAAATGARIPATQPLTAKREGGWRR